MLVIKVRRESFKFAALSVCVRARFYRFCLSQLQCGCDGNRYLNFQFSSSRKKWRTCEACRIEPSKFREKRLKLTRYENRDESEEYIIDGTFKTFYDHTCIRGGGTGSFGADAFAIRIYGNGSRRKEANAPRVC